MFFPPATWFPIGMLVPGAAVCFAGGPTSCEPGESTSHGGPGSLPIEIVRPERISFQVKQPGKSIPAARARCNCRLALFRRGLGVE